METKLAITHVDQAFTKVEGLMIYEEAAATRDRSTIMLTLKRNYLTWEDDPALADLWDNEEDAAAFNDRDV
ncbi:MAG: hypothetical protein WEB04_00615 [Dehalococcoidia bacterium]